MERQSRRKQKERSDSFRIERGPARVVWGTLGSLGNILVGKGEYAAEEMGMSGRKIKGEEGIDIGKGDESWVNTVSLNISLQIDQNGEMSEWSSQGTFASHVAS